MKIFYTTIESETHTMKLYQEEGKRAVVNIENKEKRNYVPRIYASFILRIIPEFKDFELEIQTTSYGALNQEEFKKFMNAQNAVLEAVEKFTEILKTIKPEYQEYQEEA